MKESVTDWLNGLATNFYDRGLDKCLNCSGDYVIYNKMVITLKITLVSLSFIELYVVSSVISYSTE
jgi:hypothetical protein